jgi:5-methylcytosine-specific restriction protein A
MQKPPRPCVICRRPVKRGGRCAEHLRQYENRRRRPNATERGYDQEHRTRFRTTVLERDPICPCGAIATVADHYPLSRRELVAKGMDANDPIHGRGLCGPCHSTITGVTKK